MRLSVILLLALGACAQSIAPGRPVLSEQLTHTKTDERIAKAEALLRQAPANFQYQVELTSAYLQKLRETGDLTYLTRAATLNSQMLEADGGNPTALRFENEIDLQRHEFRQVADRAQDMLKYAPSDSGLWGNLGDSLMELGEYDRASAAYIRMFSLGANLASYNRLAWYKFVSGDPEHAIALMKNAIEAGDPVPENTAWCLAELGDMYFKIGKTSEAAASYRKALDIFPTLHRAWAGLGKVSSSQGEPAKAIQDYRRAQEIVPLPEYAGALEDLYASAGDLQKTKQERALIATIEKLGRANGEKANRNLALLLADHDRDVDLALTLMENELPQRGDVYTWDAYSWVLFKKGRVVEAQAASARALRLGTPEPVFYFHAQQIANAAGNEKASGEYTARLAALNPNFRRLER